MANCISLAHKGDYEAHIREYISLFLSPSLFLYNFVELGSPPKVYSPSNVMSKVERHLFIGVSSRSPSSFFRRHILLYKPDITWPRIILRTDGMTTSPGKMRISIPRPVDESHPLPLGRRERGRVRPFFLRSVGVPLDRHGATVLRTRGGISIEWKRERKSITLKIVIWCPGHNMSPQTTGSSGTVECHARTRTHFRTIDKKKE